MVEMMFAIGKAFADGFFGVLLYDSKNAYSFGNVRVVHSNAYIHGVT